MSKLWCILLCGLITCSGASAVEGVKIPLIIKGVGTFAVEQPRDISFKQVIADVHYKLKGDYQVIYVLTIRLDESLFASYEVFSTKNLGKKVKFLFDGKELVATKFSIANKIGKIEIASTDRAKFETIKKTIIDYMKSKGVEDLQ